MGAKDDRHRGGGGYADGWPKPVQAWSVEAQTLLSVLLGQAGVPAPPIGGVLR